MMVDSFEHGNWCHYSQKTYVFLKLVGKYVRLKKKKKVNVLLFDYNSHYWICLNMPK